MLTPSVVTIRVAWLIKWACVMAFVVSALSFMSLAENGRMASNPRPRNDRVYRIRGEGHM